MALYVEGDYEGAQRTLEAMDRSELSDEYRVQYYLYLGRAYYKQAMYSEASDAFIHGREFGEAERFDAYLRELNEHLKSSSGTIAREDRVTRAQLAVQIEAEFDLSAQGKSVPVLPADVESHWASQQIEAVLASGAMQLLPDGAFHPDAYVTRTAFAVILRRVGGFVDYNATLKAADGDIYVSGQETEVALQSVMRID